MLILVTLIGCPCPYAEVTWIWFHSLSIHRITVSIGFWYILKLQSKKIILSPHHEDSIHTISYCRNCFHQMDLSVNYNHVTLLLHPFSYAKLRRALLSATELRLPPVSSADLREVLPSSVDHGRLPLRSTDLRGAPPILIDLRWALPSSAQLRRALQISSKVYRVAQCSVELGGPPGKTVKLRRTPSRFTDFRWAPLSFPDFQRAFAELHWAPPMPVKLRRALPSPEAELYWVLFSSAEIK